MGQRRWRVYHALTLAIRDTCKAAFGYWGFIRCLI